MVSTDEKKLENLMQRGTVDIIVKKDFEDIFKGFSKREREIIELRFGLNGSGTHTLKELGDKYNLSRERIRQIQKKALGKLRSSEIIQSYRNEL